MYLMKVGRMLFGSWPRRGATLGAIIIVATGVVFGLTIAQKAPWPDPQLISAKQSTSWPLYYPETLPKGFKFQKQSVKQSDAVVIYTLLYEKDKKLFVSAVPKPAGVQFSDFYNRVLSNKIAVLSTQGTAVMGSVNHQLVASLVTDKSWITMNAPSGIDTTALQSLLTSLKPL
jgi:hypothetical protein